MDKYLLQILHEFKTIIIPGLGALTVTNTATGEIMFMSYLKYDDGKLSKHIADKEGIDENDAKNTIAKYVRDIQHKLDQGETYDMFQFGQFFKNNEGDIDFKNWNEMGATAPIVDSPVVEEEPQTIVVQEENPAEVEEEVPAVETEIQVQSEVVLEPEVETEVPKPSLDDILYASEAMEIAEQETLIEESKEEAPSIVENVAEEKQDDIKDEKVEPIVPLQEETKVENTPNVSAAHKIPVADKSKTELIENENVYIAPDEVKQTETTNTKPVQKKKGAGYWILMILAIIVVIGGTFTFMFYDKIPFLNKKEVVKEEPQKDQVEEYIDEILSEEGNENEDFETVEPKNSTVTETPIKEEPIKEEKVQTQVIQSSSTGEFHLIIGAFGVQANAEKLSQKLNAEGNAAKVIGPRNGMYLVSVASFNSQQEANQNSGKYAGSWVLKN
jgi:hypothetical protein